MIRSLVVQLLLLPLRFYKWAISPLLPPMCRFHPSCSVYAMGAIAVHGPFKGTWLAARRVTRCHPFNAGGLDPVPPREGVAAAEILSRSEPELAARLNAPPHPMLGPSTGLGTGPSTGLGTGPSTGLGTGPVAPHQDSLPQRGEGDR